MSAVLLYNFTPEKEGAVRAVCQKLSLRCTAVPAARHGCTLGEALRGGGVGRAAFPPLRGELMVMELQGFLLDVFLQALREAQADTPLKAVVTPTNVSWTPSALAKELQRERAEILKKR